MPIHLWTTVEPLGLVCSHFQGTGTADRADRVTPGYGPLNWIGSNRPTQHCWQSPIVQRRIVRPGTRSKEPQHSSHDKPHDDDDDDELIGFVLLTNLFG